MATQEQLDKENQESLIRQRNSRSDWRTQRDLKDARNAALSTAQSTSERRIIKETYEGAVYNLDTSYAPTQNKTDYESDIGQRGIDQFTAPEATPEQSGGGGGGGDIEFNGSVMICINGSPYYIDIPYDSDTGAYAASDGANFPITQPT